MRVLGRTCPRGKTRLGSQNRPEELNHTYIESFAWLQRTEEAMYAKRCAAFILFVVVVVIVGLVDATENYADYGGKLLLLLFHEFIHLLFTRKHDLSQSSHVRFSVSFK